MSKRDIGAGWTVVEVVDSRVREGEDMAEREDELGFSLSEPRRCYCCDSEIQILVFIARGEEEQMVGSSCARKARLGALPPRTRSRKAKPVVAPRIEPAAPPVDPCPEIVAADYATTNGDVDLLALCAAIGIATPAWT